MLEVTIESKESAFVGLRGVEGSSRDFALYLDRSRDSVNTVY